MPPLPIAGPAHERHTSVAPISSYIRKSKREEHEMPLRVLSAAVVVILGASACAVDLPRDDLDLSIEQAMSDWNIPGLALAIVKDGQVAHLRGYGYQNIDEKTPVDENTIFGIGSSSKSFGAAVIGVLVHEGKLDWDDRVIDHLPDFQLADPYVTRELTVRDLLCHRSGVETNNTIFFGSVTRDDIVYKARFLRQSASLRSRFSYHNIMILTAGQVAARVAGTSWDEAVREKIFQPLGMDRTCTSISEFDRYTNVSTPHVWKDGKLVTIPWLNVDNTGPAGCINSSASDMANWIQVHLDEGQHDGRVIWNADVQRQMFSPHTILPGRMTGQPVGYTNFGLYGLGWMMHDYRGKKIVHHGGATDGMGAFVGLVPEEKLGVAILHNTTQSPLLTLLFYGIVDSYLGVQPAERTNLGPPRRRARPQPSEAPIAEAGRAPSLPLERYTGVYSHPIYERVEVEFDHGNLVLDFDLYPRATLEHTDQDMFKMRFEEDMSSMWDLVFGRESYVSFHVDADVGADELSMSIFGDFTRVEDVEE
jgi:CubicO group peptidase (beta-lactamase class C family)